MKLHLEFSSETLRCKAFDPAGRQIAEWEMHDAAVNGPGFGHDGRCPRGTYALGKPVRKDTVPFGPWFIPVLNVPGRGGIGIHGGGSGLRDPFAPRQGFVPTEGCLRMLNVELEHAVPLVEEAEGDAWITIAGP